MERFIEQWKQQQLDRYNYITNGRNSFKATAGERHTLTDGTIILTPDEGKWIGNPVTFEDGTLLPPGEYELVSGPRSNGGVLVVGKNGIIKELRPLQDNGIKNRHVPLYEGQITIGEYRRNELAKLPENQKLRRDSIDRLIKKVDDLRKSIRPEPIRPAKSFDFDTNTWHLKK